METTGFLSCLIVLILACTVGADFSAAQVDKFKQFLDQVVDGKMPVESEFELACSEIRAAFQTAGNSADKPDTVRGALIQGTLNLVEDCDQLYEETTVAQGCAKKGTIGSRNLSSKDFWQTLVNALLPGNALANQKITEAGQYRQFCNVVKEIRDRVAQDPDECSGRPAKPKTAIYDWIRTAYQCSRI